MSVCDDNLEDIEDIVGEGDLVGLERSITRANAVIRRVKKATSNKKRLPDLVNNEFNTSESVIPGTQRIWVKTWGKLSENQKEILKTYSFIGCAHNNSDSEYMAGQLAAYGYTITETKDNANLWLLNSCTVKTPAEDHFKNEIDDGRSKGIPVVVAGCGK